MTVETVSVTNGQEVGSGFDCDAIRTDGNIYLALFNVSQKTWSYCKIDDDGEDLLKIAKNAASCPYDLEFGDDSEAKAAFAKTEA